MHLKGCSSFGMHSESTPRCMTATQTKAQMPCKSANGLCATMLETLYRLETFHILQSLLICSRVMPYEISHSPVPRAAPLYVLRLRTSLLLVLLCFISGMCLAQSIKNPTKTRQISSDTWRCEGAAARRPTQREQCTIL